MASTPGDEHHSLAVSRREARRHRVQRESAVGEGVVMTESPWRAAGQCDLLIQAPSEDLYSSALGPA